MTTVLLDPATGDRLVLDGHLRTNVGDSSQVTEHPIASGADITDHTQDRAVTALLDLVHTESPRPGLGLDTGPERVQESLAWIRDRRAVPLDILTPDRPALRSMLSEDRSYSFGVERSVRQPLRFRQATFVDAQTTATTAPTPRDDFDNRDPGDRGEQPTSEANETQSRDASALTGLIDTLIGGG